MLVEFFFFFFRENRPIETRIAESNPILNTENIFVEFLKHQMVGHDEKLDRSG